MNMTQKVSDASFDAVVACLVFEHIREVDEAIGEVARVLQPGGPVFGQVLTLPEFERAVHEEARSLS